MKLIPAICPRCGADLDLPENSPKAYCMYCGTQILVGRVGASLVKCKGCEGFGRVDICRACSGTGNCSWSTKSPGYRSNDLMMMRFSSHCEDGMCSACHGSGRYKMGGCPACNGTGRCPQCLGTAKCQACHGLGNFPDPYGYEECKLCHGTGTIDAGTATWVAPPIVGACPDCGKALHDENPQCPYCGFVRRKCPGCGEMWVPGKMFCEKCGFGKAPPEESK